MKAGAIAWEFLSVLGRSPQSRESRLQCGHSRVCLSPLLLPSKAAHTTTMSASLARYESFLINNVSTISTLESSLRSVTWFLPGRFKDAELASEAR